MTPKRERQKQWREALPSLKARFTKDQIRFMKRRYVDQLNTYTLLSEFPQLVSGSVSALLAYPKNPFAQRVVMCLMIHQMFPESTARIVTWYGDPEGLFRFKTTDHEAELKAWTAIGAPQRAFCFDVSATDADRICHDHW